MKKSEDKIQQESVIWFRNNNLNTDNLIFSVPNSGKNPREQMVKKATGLLAGVSDIIVVMNGNVHFFEFKDENGRQSESQKDFETKINNQKLRYFIVRSLEDFQQIIQSLKNSISEEF